MAGNSKGIRAGQAFISLSLNDSALSRGLAAVQAKLQRFGSSVRNVGLQMAGLGTAMLAPLAVATKQYADFGSQIYDLSKRTGMSTEALSTLGYAAEQSGTSIQGLEAGIRRMSKVIQEASTGASGAGDTLRELGLSVSELQGLSVEGRFDKMLQALANIDDDGKRAALAMEAFGKSGTQLLPMLDGGFEGLQQLRGELRGMGGELSALDASQADALGDAIGKLTRGFGVLRNEVGKALAPTITKIADEMSGMTRTVADFITKNQSLVVGIAAVAAGFLSVGAAAAGLGLAISGVASAFGALAAVATPLGFVGAAFTAWIALTVDWKKAIEDVKKAIGGIAMAVSQEDYAAAGRLAGEAFKQSFHNALQGMYESAADAADALGSGGLISGLFRYGAEAEAKWGKVNELMIAGERNRLRLSQKYVDLMQRHEDRQKWIKEHAAQRDKDNEELAKQRNKPTGNFWFQTIPDLMGEKVGTVLERLRSSGIKWVQDQWTDLEIAAASYVEKIQAAGEVWDDTRTPMERYKKRAADLQQMFNEGFLKQDTLDRALKQAKDEMQNSLLAEIDVSDMSGVSMFGGNRAAQVFAAETYQRQAIALAKQQVGELQDVNRNLQKFFVPAAFK